MMSEQRNRRLRGTRTVYGFLVVSSIILIHAIGANTARAGEPAPPDAAAVLDKYIEVTGGKEAYERIHNRVIKQRVVHVDMDFEDSLVGYHAAPNHRYVAIESDALGSTLQGTDGDIVWYLSDQAGTMIEQGEARAASLEGGAFDRKVHWRKYFKNVEYVGEETLKGKACHKIVLTPHHGKPETCYYDKQSHLLVKAIVTRLSSNMPETTMDLTFSDYRWVDGLLISHKLERSFEMCGTKREMVFLTESIEHNVDIPPDRFDPPAKVKAMALAQKVSSTITKAVTGDGATAPPKQGGCCGGGTETSVSSDASSGCGGSSGCGSGGECGGSSGCGGGGSEAGGSGTCGGQTSAAPKTRMDDSKQGGCGGL